MNGEVHELYKELSQAINDLSKDMVKGLVSLRAVAGDNKADIERVEKRFERDLRALQDKVESLKRAEGGAEKKIEALEKEIGELKRAAQARADAEGKVKIEATKGRWAFWVAIAGGSAGVITTIANIIANALGWGN